MYHMYYLFQIFFGKNIHVMFCEFSYHLILAPATCLGMSEEISSHFGSNSFLIDVIKSDDTLENAKDALVGSESSITLNSTEYLIFHDFRTPYGDIGSIELVGLTFDVDVSTTVVFMLTDSYSNQLFPNGVSNKHAVDLLLPLFF